MGLMELPSFGFVEERGPSGGAFCLYVLAPRASKQVWSNTVGHSVMGSCSNNLRHTQGFAVAVLEGTEPVNVDATAVKFEPVVPMFNIPDSNTLFREYKIVFGKKPGADTRNLIIEDTEYSILAERLQAEMMAPFMRGRKRRRKSTPSSMTEEHKKRLWQEVMRKASSMSEEDLRRLEEDDDD